jgi:mannan polymerase II complex MNN10 subunit
MMSPVNPVPAYERAQLGHIEHNSIHGYPEFVLRKALTTDIWSKPAYLLSIILEELAKPAREHLEWLLYVSRALNLEFLSDMTTGGMMPM